PPGPGPGRTSASSWLARTLASEHASRALRGGGARVVYELAVHPHPLDAGGGELRILRGGPVHDRRRIEEDEGGVGPGPKLAAAAEPDVVGGQGRNTARRLLERNHPPLAHVAAEHAREGAEAARMAAVQLA